MDTRQDASRRLETVPLPEGGKLTRRDVGEGSAMSAATTRPPGSLIVRTVLGDIPAERMGRTMCHDHILIDEGHVSFREPNDSRDAALLNRPVALDIFGWIPWN
jgi:hypothetical protein